MWITTIMRNFRVSLACTTASKATFQTKLLTRQSRYFMLFVRHPGLTSIITISFYDWQGNPGAGENQDEQTQSSKHSWNFYSLKRTSIGVRRGLVNLAFSLLRHCEYYSNKSTQNIWVRSGDSAIVVFLYHNFLNEMVLYNKLCSNLVTFEKEEEDVRTNKRLWSLEW